MLAFSPSLALLGRPVSRNEGSEVLCCEERTDSGHLSYLGGLQDPGMPPKRNAYLHDIATQPHVLANHKGRLTCDGHGRTHPLALQVTAFSNANFKSFKTLNEAKGFMSSGLSSQEVRSVQQPRQLTLPSSLLGGIQARAPEAIQEGNADASKKRKRDQIKGSTSFDLDDQEWYHMVRPLGSCLHT